MKQLTAGILGLVCLLLVPARVKAGRHDFVDYEARGTHTGITAVTAQGHIADLLGWNKEKTAVQEFTLKALQHVTRNPKLVPGDELVGTLSLGVLSLKPKAAGNLATRRPGTGLVIYKYLEPNDGEYGRVLPIRSDMGTIQYIGVLYVRKFADGRIYMHKQYSEIVLQELRRLFGNAPSDGIPENAAGFKN